MHPLQFGTAGADTLVVGSWWAELIGLTEQMLPAVWPAEDLPQARADLRRVLDLAAVHAVESPSELAAAAPIIVAAFAAVRRLGVYTSQEKAEAQHRARNLLAFLIHTDLLQRQVRVPSVPRTDPAGLPRLKPRTGSASREARWLRADERALIRLIVERLLVAGDGRAEPEKVAAVYALTEAGATTSEIQYVTLGLARQAVPHGQLTIPGTAGRPTRSVQLDAWQRATLTVVVERRATGRDEEGPLAYQWRDGSQRSPQASLCRVLTRLYQRAGIAEPGMRPAGASLAVPAALLDAGRLTDAATTSGLSHDRLARRLPTQYDTAWAAVSAQQPLPAPTRNVTVPSSDPAEPLGLGLAAEAAAEYGWLQ